MEIEVEEPEEAGADQAAEAAEAALREGLERARELVRHYAAEIVDLTAEGPGEPVDVPNPVRP